MHSVQRAFSALAIFILCTQPVLGIELLPEEATIPTESVAEVFNDESLQEIVVPETDVHEENVADTEADNSETTEISLDTATSTDISVEVPPESTTTDVTVTDLLSPSVSEVGIRIKPTVSESVETIASNLSENEIIIKYNNDDIDLTTAKGRRASSRLTDGESLEIVESLPESNVALVKVSGPHAMSRTLRALQKDEQVAYAQPNYEYFPAEINTNDTLQSLLWGLETIHAPEAWALAASSTGNEVIAAVIDTGVAYNHPDLSNRMWDGTNCVDENGDPLGGCIHGYDFEDEDTDPLPTHNVHGTHIAGTIAATRDNEIGVAGVSTHASIMAIKTDLTTFDIVRSIHFATQNDARIINASWAGPAFDQALYDAIATFPGLFVTAAGNASNNNDAFHYYPADYELENVLSVAATDQNDALASFSNFGATTVDVGAPGVDIYSTVIATTTVEFESFDTISAPDIPSGWTTEGDSTNWGTEDTEDYLWGVVLYGDVSYPYASSTDTTVTSKAYDLTNGNTTIDFFTACDTEFRIDDWSDYMQLEYSADGSTFEVAIDPFTGEQFRWDEAMLASLQGSTEDSEFGYSYHYEHIPVPEAYHTNTFRFRLRWVTNEVDNDHYGCIIDDIQLLKLGDGSEETYGYLTGTSMATPHVAGLAALIGSSAPDLSPLEIKELILESGDELPSLLGTTVSGKRINAQNALQVINARKLISAFTLPQQVGSTTIHEDTHTITITVPFGTNIATITPSISIQGASLSPQTGIPQNFTSPVLYTVTALDGTTQEYTVSITIAPEVVIPVVTPPVSRSSGGGGGGGSSSKQKTEDTYKVVINDDDASTPFREVELTITKVKGATHIRLSNTSDMSSAVWVPFTTALSWTLSSGSGKKTVYVEYGKNNNVVGDAKDSIRLTELVTDGGLDALPEVTHTPLVSDTTLSTSDLFTQTLSTGARNSEVTELQKILIQEGFLAIAYPTGYFGPMTATALKAYQRAHLITATGIVDEATRTQLNTATSMITAETQKALLIKTLLAKLQELIAELNALKAQQQ